MLYNATEKNVFCSNIRPSYCYAMKKGILNLKPYDDKFSVPHYALVFRAYFITKLTHEIECVFALETRVYLSKSWEILF